MRVTDLHLVRLLQVAAELGVSDADVVREAARHAKVEIVRTKDGLTTREEIHVDDLPRLRMEVERLLKEAPAVPPVAQEPGVTIHKGK